MTDFFRVFIKSSFTVRITGENPHRFLNAAAAKGIFVSSVNPVKDGLNLTLSKEAWRIMKEELPEGLTMERISEHGAAKVLRPLKKRYVLFGGGIIALAAWVLFSSFIWKIEVVGESEELKEKVESFLEEKGIGVPILKKSIDQNEIKREAILSIDELMWLWVDIRGTTAYVRTEPRDLPPEKLNYEPGNVIADETGIVEKITVLEGVAKIGEGETVEKGSILISGAVESERIDTMIRHGRGTVIARIWREKTVNIPKITEIRHRTEDVRKIKSLKIKKFIVNFSLNSRFFYPKYDKIRVSYKLGELPVELISDSYIRVETEETQTDMELAEKEALEEFEKELQEDGAEIVSTDIQRIDMGDSMEIKITAECLRDIGVEVPM